MTETFERLPSIPIFLDARSVRSGSPSYIGWEAGSSTQHHFLISGNSGSGKSTHLMLCLAKVQKYMPRSTRLYLMDFKGSDDFRYLRDVPNARYFASALTVSGHLARKSKAACRITRTGPLYWPSLTSIVASYHTPP